MDLITNSLGTPRPTLVKWSRGIVNSLIKRSRNSDGLTLRSTWRSIRDDQDNVPNLPLQYWATSLATARGQQKDAEWSGYHVLLIWHTPASSTGTPTTTITTTSTTLPPSSSGPILSQPIRTAKRSNSLPPPMTTSNSRQPPPLPPQPPATSTSTSSRLSRPPMPAPPPQPPADPPAGPTTSSRSRERSHPRQWTKTTQTCHQFLSHQHHHQVENDHHDTQGIIQDEMEIDPTDQMINQAEAERQQSHQHHQELLHQAIASIHWT
eukprot:917433-Amphidinium_carterae.3